MENGINSILDTKDITKLREEYQKITSVLAGHQIALWEYDILTGKCSFTDEYFQILGLKEAGIYFVDIDDFYRFAHPDDVIVYQTAFEKMLESDTKTSQIVVRCVGSHGEIIWLEDNFISYQKAQDGQSDKIIAYTVIITSRCEKELHIRRLEERNKKIIEALPEFIFIFDDNFFIRDVLIAPGIKLLHPVEMLKGIDGRTVYSPEVSDLFIHTIHDCLEDGLLKEIEYPLDTNDERYYFQARIVPFEDNKVLALIHDIGDRVRRSQELVEAKQRAEEADRMKSVFLANMSHEIRTPLNAIVGFSEIIALTEDEKEKIEYLKIIQQNSNLLLQLINDILDLSRIESGKSEMYCQLTEICGLVDEVEKVHRLKMKDGVELIAIRPEEDYWISTDRNRVTQVLFNFLSNAIKNTKKGSITLGLSKENEWIKIFVTDTGCGIPEDKLPLIFNRFEKVNDFVQGTGLGLPICKSIVERLGGKIEVESELGKGSTFYLYLPCQEKHSQPDEKRIVTVHDTDRTHRKKILIAEDVESNYLQISAFLKKEYTVLWVSNGEEAVKRFLREVPDLILMDIRMPIMNGIEATAKIRTYSESVPIIAITAYACCQEGDQALRAGCNEIIAKPYPLEKLKETIEAYIR